ncbi:complex III assembly factor LYRM7 isoform X1 [Cardiocondyla obscurior]|uniref:complex III assembly factor LYRM7-like isoform X1 n=1 Tax=Cardiocondyla obscurior TaxID=286306 RepID=UPI0039656674
MTDPLRREVLRVFKKLHRTRLNTFEGDEYALQVLRDKINNEYRKYKNVTNQAAIEELNKFAQEVEHEVRTTVIQAIETEPGKVALRLTSDVLVDNVPYKDQKNNKSVITMMTFRVCTSLCRLNHFLFNITDFLQSILNSCCISYGPPSSNFILKHLEIIL